MKTEAEYDEIFKSQKSKAAEAKAKVKAEQEEATAAESKAATAKKDKEDMSVTAGCGWILLVILLIGVIGYMGSEDRAKPAGPDFRDAYYTYQIIIERQLKSPRSAHWPPLSSTDHFQQDNGWLTFKGYVDADNSFGASMRTPYIITVSRTANGWKAETLILNGVMVK